MELFTILVIAVILALDCFAVAIAAGSSRVPNKGRLALFLAIPFGFFQFAMTIAGWAAGARTVAFVSGFDHWAAFCILAVIGVKMVYEGLRNDVERVPVYNAPTIIMLSLATSVDALGAGLSLAFLGGHIGTSSVIIGLTSFTFAFAGVLLGRRLGEHLGRSMEIVGGLILLVIGLRILVESIV